MIQTQLRTGADLLAALEGLYFLLSGVWPLVPLDSFLAVTGPKTDLWLVQTVGALVAVAEGVFVVRWAAVAARGKRS